MVTATPHADPRDRPSPRPWSDGRMDGRTIGGRYRLLEQRAIGGMAAVWRAIDERTGRQVAIKLLQPHLAADRGARGGCASKRRDGDHRSPERRRRPRASSPTRSARPSSWIGSKVDPSASASRRTVASPEGEALAIARDIADGLAAVHAAGLVHRDVKPEHPARRGRAGAPDRPRHRRRRRDRRAGADRPRRGRRHASGISRRNGWSARRPCRRPTCGAWGSCCSRCSRAAAHSRRPPSSSGPSRAADCRIGRMACPMRPGRSSSGRSPAIPPTATRTAPPWRGPARDRRSERARPAIRGRPDRHPDRARVGAVAASSRGPPSRRSPAAHRALPALLGLGALALVAAVAWSAGDGGPQFDRSDTQAVGPTPRRRRHRPTSSRPRRRRRPRRSNPPRATRRVAAEATATGNGRGNGNGNGNGNGRDKDDD